MSVRIGALVAASWLAAGAGGLFVPARAEWDANPIGGVVTSQHYLCGSRDLPEGPVQGHVPKADQESRRAELGYNCGLALVGYTALSNGGRPNVNANMAWAGSCAYVSSSAGAAVVPQTAPSPPPGAGVAVVSVSSKGIPRHVATIRSPGALTTSETIHAVTTPQGRSILVVGQYGNDVASGPKPMDVYDVSDPDCTKFRHVTTFWWPTNIHNLTISPDGRYVFATIPLQAADISGLWDDDPKTDVVYLGNIEQAMQGPPVAVGPAADLDDAVAQPAWQQTHPFNTSHEAWVSADNTTLYVGAQTPTFELFTILDIRDWLARNPDGSPQGPPRIISQTSGRGHSVRTATIGGAPYILHSEESPFGAGWSCVPETVNPFAGPAQPWLTDISDPRRPRLVSQFGLEINDPSNCSLQLEARESNSVHYHDVDDPADTTFVMASMWNSGLRVFDVRDPTNPTEVAYFNPGDVDPTPATRLDHAWGHVRYVPESGHIWFATASGGFWVVRIEGRVRAYLGLDPKNVRRGLKPLGLPHDDSGHPGTVGAALRPPLTGYAETTRYSCWVPAARPPGFDERT